MLYWPIRSQLTETHSPTQTLPKREGLKRRYIAMKVKDITNRLSKAPPCGGVGGLLYWPSRSPLTETWYQNPHCLHSSCIGQVGVSSLKRTTRLK